MRCIEKGLGKFGPDIKYAVMWKTVVLGDSPKEGILVNPKAFVSALQSAFGHSAKIIEQEVVDEIKARADPEFSEMENLTDLINALRRQCNAIFIDLTCARFWTLQAVSRSSKACCLFPIEWSMPVISWLFSLFHPNSLNCQTNVLAL